MKSFLLSVTFILLSASLNAQEQDCGTDEYMQEKYMADPSLKAQIQEYMLRRSLNPTSTLGGDRAANGIIPCVVHILHDNGPGNLSMAQIESAIDMLNEDFGLMNPDLPDVRNTAEAPFLPVAADIEITFELARIDPNGDCTNGVQRRYSPSAAYDANDNVKFWSSGGLDAWPCDEYMNIWVANTVTSSGGSALNGYAQFPYGGCDNTYGIVIRNGVFGNVGTGSGGRTLSHEVGHCLGLFHTFQDGCHTSNCNANGDYVCDTPPVDGPQWSCVTTQNTCTSVPSGDFYGFDAWDQFENLMSYSPCRMMLSQGQKNLMEYNLGDIWFLGNLTSTFNATQTGVDVPGVACAADFFVDESIICAGNSVSFTDNSYHNITSWIWTFEGGVPATSTDQNPIVTYSAGGVYSVTLQVSDGTLTAESIFDDYIFVLADPGQALPYKEGFETLTLFPDNQSFIVEDENADDAWELTTGVACFGNTCAWLNNYGNIDGTSDAFISGPIDLSGVDAADPIVFDFVYAYKRRFSTNIEELRFYISKDCGETWALRKLIKGDELGPEQLSSPYEPVSTAEWIQVNVTNINSPYYVSNFMFKFEFTNDFGNNIYIDNINLYPESMTGLGHLDVNKEIAIYPNPTTDGFQIIIDVQNDSDYEITLIDNLGQSVRALYSADLSAGTNKLDFSLSGLPVGSYIIRIKSDFDQSSYRIVKQ